MPFDVAVDELVNADPTALGAAARAYTMHSHVVMKTVDDALAALGDLWVALQEGCGPGTSGSAGRGGQPGPRNLAGSSSLPLRSPDEFLGAPGGFGIGHTDLDPLGRGAGSAAEHRLHPRG